MTDVSEVGLDFTESDDIKGISEESSAVRGSDDTTDGVEIEATDVASISGMENSAINKTGSKGECLS